MKIVLEECFKMKTLLIARRVSYGKKSTPVSDREYQLIIGGTRIGPVGTKKEWRTYAKKNKVMVRFVE